MSAPDPVVAALAGLLFPVVREAVIVAFAEHAESQPLAPSLLTNDQLAQALQISRSSLYRLVDAGMPRLMVLDSPRYRLPDVLAWLDSQQGVRRAG